MAWLRIEKGHQAVLELLVTSSRVASAAGRAKTGPYSELRQVILLAAGLGAALSKRRAVEAPGPTAVRDGVMWDGAGALELAFALAYRDSDWDLQVLADGDAASDARLKVLEEYATAGFDSLAAHYETLGSSVSAADLLMEIKKQVPPVPPQLENSPAGEREEDPLIAMLRRRGKLPARKEEA